MLGVCKMVGLTLLVSCCTVLLVSCCVATVTRMNVVVYDMAQRGGHALGDVDVMSCGPVPPIHIMEKYQYQIELSDDGMFLVLPALPACTVAHVHGGTLLCSDLVLLLKVPRPTLHSKCSHRRAVPPLALFFVQVLRFCGTLARNRESL